MAQISKQALIVENNQSFPNNNNGAITPSELRGFNVDMIDSTVNQTQYNTDSGSWNQQIDALEVFTSSQQPSFTALNSFTASQLVINSGVNTFTQSANGRLTALENDTANLEAFTSSINQIIVNGASIGTSTRLFFNGFVSASIIPNVGGAIASITVLSDPSKLDSSSFNAYTASTAATQSVFSASVATSISQSSAAFSAFSSSQNSFNLSATASLVELLNLSSSLSGGYATQGELDQSASVLQANIDTKLNTSSFNAYTQSVTQFGFATTGSNSFNGNQNITGSLILSSSNAVELQVIGDSLFTGSVIISSSAAIDLEVKGNMRVTGSVAGQRTAMAPDGLFSFNGNSQSNMIAGVITNTNGVNSQYISTAFGGVIGNYAESDFSEIGLALDGNEFTTNWANGPILYVNNTAGDTYEAVFGFQNKTNYTDGRVTVLKPLIAQQGAVISGSTTITGSVYGNVRGITISSNTASIDLSVSNFFTLTLVSGSTTHLTATNIRPGQTINLLVAQPSVGTGSVSYSTSIFDFPAGANYIPTPITGSKDIISFISFDSSILYATSINNLA